MAGYHLLRQVQLAQELLEAGVVSEGVEAGVGKEGYTNRQLISLSQATQKPGPCILGALALVVNSQLPAPSSPAPPSPSLLTMGRY